MPLALIAATIVAGFSPQLSRAEELAPDPAKIRDHVAYLASDDLGGRDSGEPGLEIAAEYLARFYAEYGLAPAGDTGTYFQHFTVPHGADFGHLLGAEVLEAGGAPRKLLPVTQVVPFGYGKPGIVEAPVVFAGYGITAPEQAYEAEVAELITRAAAGPRAVGSGAAHRGAAPEEALVQEGLLKLPRDAVAALVSAF
ncbi:MAG: hypothetical protein HRU37_14045 [Roseibacillus sp.]|nr:hypothetical protein [Roseibacillus sp.]